jgi:hypothetical protein
VHLLIFVPVVRDDWAKMKCHIFPQIRINGHLGPDFSGWFDSMTITLRDKSERMRKQRWMLVEIR